MIRSLYLSPLLDLSAGSLALVRTLMVIPTFCAAGAALGVLAAADPTYETSIGALI